jgi:very-short-patch-repair endonuclease
LPADEVTVHERIPVTTIGRTLLDLAAVLDLEHLEQAIARADHLRLASSPALPELMQRYPRRAGTANLRRVLGESGLGRGIASSELEVRFLAFLRRYGLPRPEVNVRLGVRGREYEVDCLWRESSLVVELDSRRHHDDPVAFETDRARDRALIAAGYRCMRVTWRHLHDHDVVLAADLRAAITRRSAG